MAVSIGSDRLDREFEEVAKARAASGASVARVSTSSTTPTADNRNSTGTRGIIAVGDGEFTPLSRRKRRLRYFAAAVAAILGLTVSGVAYVATSNWEQRVSELKLLELATNDQQKLNFDLKSATAVLYTLRAFYNASDHAVTRSEFLAFAKDVRGRLPGLRDTGFAQRVTRDERGVFETSVRLQGFPDFEIWERDSTGARVRAGDRAEYFPILFPDTEQPKSQIFGFDIGSEPVRADAVHRALISGEPAATAPLNLVTKAERGGFMTFLPVYPRNDDAPKTSRAPVGLMYGVFGTASTIESILGSRAVSSGLDIYFFNPKESSAKRFIYWHSSPSRREPTSFPSEEALLRGANWVGGVKVADQEWSAVFSPFESSVVDAESWRPLAVLVVALATTSSIVTYLLVSLRRTLRLEHLTASLRATTEELARESEKVSHLAHHDSLTGLPNRVTFNKRLFEAFQAAKLGGGLFAVICLDLDHFKEVNDTLGHPSGDRLLQITADRIRANVGDTDVVARLGGDEFAILLSSRSNPEEIGRLAAQINTALAKNFDLANNETHVSASLGVSLFDPTVDSPEEMMKRADVALYEAKKSRNSYSIHSDALDTEIRERVTTARELQVAIDSGELELYYQPQIEVFSDRIVGMEALIPDP